MFAYILHGYFTGTACDAVVKVMGTWASYQIRKIAGCACAGNAGNVSPRRRFKMKPLVSDPGMHHGTCVTHVPWCMSGSLTCGDGENVPGIPGACAPAILRIWQEAHWPVPSYDMMTSSNGNKFPVIGLLWWESTGHRWIPLTKTSNAELCCFLWSSPEPDSWASNRYLRRHRAHYDFTLMEKLQKPCA